MLEDVLDGYCAVEHARGAYGVVDLDTETVDVAATEALRSRMRADPRRGDSGSAAADRRGAGARPEMRKPLAASGANRPAAAGSGEHGASVPASFVASRATPPRIVSPAGRLSIEDLVVRLNERLRSDWNFDVQRHHRDGGGIEVTGELKSNGARVQRTGTSNGNSSSPLGAQIEMASEEAFRSCAAEMLGAANRG